MSKSRDRETAKNLAVAASVTSAGMAFLYAAFSIAVLLIIAALLAFAAAALMSWAREAGGGRKSSEKSSGPAERPKES